jgi:hypothetical protein
VKLLISIILMFATSAFGQQKPSSALEAQSSGECSPNILATQGKVEFTCNTSLDDDTAKKLASLLSQLLRKEGNAATTVEDMNRKVDKLLYYLPLLASPTPGNLSERASALSKKIFTQLDTFQIALSSNPSALSRPQQDSAIFRFCCLDEVLAIRDEFAQVHLKDTKLDEILALITSHLRLSPLPLISHAEMEDIAIRLSILSSPKHPRDAPKVLHFSESPTEQKNDFKFNSEITIDTKVPLSRGFIVVEFNEPVIWQQPEINTGQYVNREDIRDNKPLTDYLDKLPFAQTFTEEILNAPFTPDRPIHVLVHNPTAFHVTRVTWFDD